MRYLFGSIFLLLALWQGIIFKKSFSHFKIRTTRENGWFALRVKPLVAMTTPQDVTLHLVQAQCLCHFHDQLNWFIFFDTSYLKTDLHILLRLIYQLLGRVAPALEYTLRLFFHSIPPYLHNNLLPKIFDFHIYISNLHVSRRSSRHFFFSNSP